MKKVYKYFSPCIDCGEPCDKRALRCQTCNNKFKSETYRGIKASNYKQGHYLETYYCSDCGTEISVECNFSGSGQCKSCSQKGKHIGKKSGCFIDGRSSKQYFCIDCGKEIHWQTTVYGQGRCHNCDNKHRIGLMCGDKNNNWQGGISFAPYPLGWTKTFKEQIRYRDGYKCQVCGCHEVECLRKLDVHHIDYNKENINPDNLTSLCQRCHGRTNGNREYWQEYSKVKNVLL